MRINKEWVSKGFFSIGNNLLIVFLRFFSFYIIVRSLSKNDFGIWVLFLIVVSIMEVVRNGFIKNALIRYIAISETSETSKIQSASLVLNFIITATGLCIVLLLSNFLVKVYDAPDLKPMFYIYSISALLLIFLSHLEFVAAAYLKFKYILIFNFSRHFVFLALVFTNPFSSEATVLQNLVFYQVISVLIGLTVGILILKSSVSITGTLSLEWISKLFHFGKFVVGTNLSMMIFKSTDQFMLGGVVNTESVAIYNTALRINNLIDAPVMGISNVFYPHSSRQGKASFSKVYVQSVSAILSILLPLLIFIFFFSDFIILLIAGKEYIGSASILRVTMLYSVFIPFARQFGTLLDSIGKPQVNLKLTLLTSLINIIASYVGIVLFGIIGAAYGTLFTYFAGFIIIQIYLNRNYNVILTEIFASTFKNYSAIYGMVRARLQNKRLK